MKVEQQFSDPEYVKDRRPYRLRIEGKNGGVIEIVEQMDGGFLITACGNVAGSSISIEPISYDKVIVRDRK